LRGCSCASGSRQISQCLRRLCSNHVRRHAACTRARSPLHAHPMAASGLRDGFQFQSDSLNGPSLKELVWDYPMCAPSSLGLQSRGFKQI
jgi:hypothetical protein